VLLRGNVVGRVTVGRESARGGAGAKTSGGRYYAEGGATTGGVSAG
jgi:hypothetical protein